MTPATKPFFPCYDENLGYFIGAMLGDGNLCVCGRNHHLRLRVKDYDFAATFGCVSEKIIGRPIKIGREGELFRVVVNRKRMFQWFKELVESHLNRVVLNNKEIARGFLRGFFDAEGSVVSDSGRICVGVKNVKKPMLELCRLCFIKFFGIKPPPVNSYSIPVGSSLPGGRITKVPCLIHTLRIHRQDDVWTFMNEVGFSIKRKSDKYAVLLNARL